MRYEFQAIQTIVVDTKDLKVVNEGQARALIMNGFGVYDEKIKFMLVHVARDEHDEDQDEPQFCGHEILDCPNHDGGFDCTPFCRICEGNQGYCLTCKTKKLEGVGV